ncbi:MULTISPECIES: hypothetical protein [Rhodovulum]|uniref:Uncharacterized protein n=2 Tax=Rhodovulum sulfidophilum TaxID=35806 RepID=A0A0D6AYC0_RHOSU|nr:hypothetical protein [Rhodovulum sulfidophilum]MBL3553474.1 hypothetical protein [Rhodovulum sulfidophilum]MBL3567177.1 hypothetical protein [Rhodovulum sulfidophilum]MBL3575344.1 hypothetical protein [Rhodovulum sulfidophilum]MBL3587821.1 hypothetical protein [Rhodovulum sulfidophilum]MBL3608989.1 hypothetical protein [Rhodovulum sulfidophilum]
MNKHLRTDDRVRRLVSAVEACGKTVQRVIVRGREVELILLRDQDEIDEFEAMDLRR